MTPARRCSASATSRCSSRDLPAAERFWVDVMGYAVEWRPDADNVYLRGGRDNLALHRATRRAPATGAGRLDHIGLAVAAPEDVDAWAAHLEAHGVALKAAPKTHRDGSRSLYFHGPEGSAGPDHPPRAAGT